MRGSRLTRHVLVVAAATLLAWAGAATAETVHDHRGREIRFAAPFRRVISLYGAHTENLFALGAGEAVVGVGRNEVYPPEATRRPVFSYHDGPEKFLAARADLVLIRPMIDRGYETLVEQLERHGIVVASLQPANIAEMLDYWILLGRLTGREPEARAMAATFQEAVGAFQELSGRLTPRKVVYFEAIHDRVKTFLPGSMPIFALETAGGVNAAADAEQVRTTNIAFYGRERLLSRGEKIDVYLAQVGAMNRPTREGIRSAPGFELIRAVREGRIHLIDETIVARPTLRLLQGIWTIGAILYPEAFCDRGRGIMDQAGLPPPEAEGLCGGDAPGGTP